MTTLTNAALVTGASTGIGATYARALAKRGHDLVLVARNRDRLEALAQEIAVTGRRTEVLVADLLQPEGFAATADRIAAPDVSLLVNNAGMAVTGEMATIGEGPLAAMTTLNVLAPTMLARAAAAAMASRGAGAIINIASVAALTGERPGISAGYGAGKAYMLALSEAMAAELAPRGVRVQAVLPGITRTPIWELSGLDVAGFPPEIVMGVEDMVAAAMTGFDLGETVTIPSLPDAADWDAFRAARDALGPNLSLRDPAPRYAGARG